MKILLVILFVIVWVGCSTDTVSNATPMITKTGDKEFNYAYTFLYYYYYLAEDELKSSDYYLTNPDTVIGKEEYADYADVYCMFREMSDLMTQYFPPDLFQKVNQAITTSPVNTKSFGMELDENLRVKYVYRFGPAATAEMKRGDQILAVDSTFFSTDSTDFTEQYQSVLQKKTTDDFDFTILRGKDTLKISMTREDVISPTVYVDSIDNIPIIRVKEFTPITNGFQNDGSAEEFEAALKETDGAKSTVLDLRGNPGGSTELCTRMAMDLLPAGDTAFIQLEWKPKGTERSIQASYFVNDKDGLGSGRYYVLLLDGNSASCAEIFATAITSNLKAPIVGETSFGKGIGQVYSKTPEKGYAVATSMLLFDKDSVSYHMFGLEPDFTIKNADSALTTAVKIAKERKEKRTAGYSERVNSYWLRVKRKAPESVEERLRDWTRGLAIQEVSVE